MPTPGIVDVAHWAAHPPNPRAEKPESPKPLQGFETAAVSKRLSTTEILLNPKHS